MSQAPVAIGGPMPSGDPSGDPGAGVSVGSTAAAENLGGRVLRGVGWVIGGQFAMQAWRLASNLVLTRLVAPEAFGLMGLVQVFLFSAQLLSDVGLRGSVIYHARGDRREFLDTVWTVAVLRGVVLWGVVCAGAYPFARFYGHDGLIWLLPLTGLSLLIRGFASTSLLTATRGLRPRWPVSVECAAQIVAATASVLLALWLRSVLALSLGCLVGALAHVGISYWPRDVRRNHFRWDRDALRALGRFGRWSMLSGLFTVVRQRGDRVVLGKLLTASDLGTYVIGANVAWLPVLMFTRVNAAVSQPLYALLRDGGSLERRRKIRRLRLGIVAGFGPPLALLVVFAQPLILFLYPPQYASAGWFCSQLALAALFLVATDLGPIYPAHGDARTHFWINGFRAVVLMALMTLGYYGGLAYQEAAKGVILGVVVAPLVSYPLQAFFYRRIDAWLPEVDFPVIGCGLALMAGKVLGWF